MDWLPKDQATWGIVLAIAAILLTFPLSLLANLLTPKIRNWWAERSITSLQQRIGALENQLAKMKSHTLLSDDQLTLIRLSQRLARIAFGFLLILGMIGIELLDEFPRKSHTFPGEALAALILMWVLAALIIDKHVAQFMNIRSNKARERIAATIKELTNKLRARQKSYQ
jgi:HAMP domain-containing protein